MFSLPYLSNLKVESRKVIIKIMVKQVVGETFEKLGQIIGQTAQQVVQEPGKMAETAAEQAGLTSEAGTEKSSTAPTPAQTAQKEAKRRRQLAAFQAELQDIQTQKTQELPKQITGKPGFTREAGIRQIKQIKIEEPLVAARARSKGGTVEKRFGVG